MKEGLSSNIEGRTIKKVAWRLLPLLIICYIIASIDRGNISYAASGGMTADLGLSATQYGFAAGVFFISYFIFEIPSNLMLEKFGARKWIARIMITWGILAMAAAFVDRAWTLYLMRFLLGAAEAGFFPGVILYMTYWFPKSYRSRVVAAFVFSVPISNGIAAAVSGWLLGMHGLLGFAGWQWLFLIEGFPAVVLAAAVLMFLTDRPEQAKWLNEEERTWLSSTISAERAQVLAQEGDRPGFWSTFADTRVLAITAIYFANLIATWGITFFMPQIVKLMGKSDLETGLLSSLPYFFTPLGLLVLSWSSDRTGERKWHCVFGATLGAVGLALAGFYSNGVLALAGFAIASAGLFGARGPLWAMPAEFLTGVRAAVGIAFINAMGNLGGLVGPPIIGWIKDQTGDYSMAVYFIAASAAISALLGILISPAKSEQKAEILPAGLKQESQLKPSAS
jgi:ACS family tartrate transporter-like MFS transporter